MVSNRVHDPFSLIIIVAGLTSIIPAGQYDRAMNEEVGREVAVPGTYQTVDPNPQGFVEVMLAPVAGFYDPDSYAANAIDVALFVLLLDGFLGVVNATKAIDTGIQTGDGLHERARDLDDTDPDVAVRLGRHDLRHGIGKTGLLCTADPGCCRRGV